jgi:hypothetical protein
MSAAGCISSEPFAGAVERNAGAQFRVCENGLQAEIAAVMNSSEDETRLVYSKRQCARQRSPLRLEIVPGSADIIVPQMVGYGAECMARSQIRSLVNTACIYGLC